MLSVKVAMKFSVKVSGGNKLQVGHVGFATIDGGMLSDSPRVWIVSGEFLTGEGPVKLNTIQ